jgi:hypothetical protein
MSDINKHNLINKMKHTHVFGGGDELNQLSQVRVYSGPYVLERSELSGHQRDCLIRDGEECGVGRCDLSQLVSQSSDICFVLDDSLLGG